MSNPVDFNALAALHVQSLQPYQSARRIGGHGHTFLNANESPKSASYFLNSTALNRYPDCQPESVITAYADYAGVRPTQVLASRGSDEAIGLIIRTFCNPGTDGIVIAPPTYGMYAVAANTNGAKIICAKRDDNFKLNAQAIIDAVKSADFKVKAVFIDTPANPLGELFPHEELELLLTALPDTLIVADEAYIEFAADHSVVPLLDKYQNLIVLRTLSKAFALAGIRCGFALADPAVIKLMLKVIDPYPISDPVAQIAAQALMTGGIALMQERVQGILQRRELLRQHLNDLACVEYIFPSQANFLLVRFKDGPKAFAAAANRGIILRSFEDKPGLKNCVRITIGSDAELDELMRVLSGIPA